MKKIFAILAALTLTPTFQANAWIGGPFSGNTYFGERGDDGVYEAIATTTNGIGIFRITVGNEFEGAPDGVNTESVTLLDEDGDPEFITPPISSGNLFIGAFGGATAAWYIEGVAYFGVTRGTVNSAQGTVIAISSASSNDGTTISASFQGRVNSNSQFIPATGFEASGEGTITDAAGDTTTFPFTVIGTKVSGNIFFGF